MHHLAAVALAGSAAITLTGCPDNACLLKVCTNGQCRCSVSTCGEGAAYDVNQSRCRCLKGFVPLAGQCLTPQAANAYCGPGWHFENFGCARDRCKPGDEIDEATGWCIPRERVNEVGRNMGVPVGQGQQLACPAGTKLVIDGPTAACVPLAQTCARDETWNGQACVKASTCPTGAIWDPARNQCVQYAQGGGSELKVDVAQWLTANYGPNGGPGAPAFCGGFAKKPWAFGVTEGNTAFVRATITVSFENGEVARGALQSASVFDASGNAVPQKGAAEVDATAKALFAPLQQGGGRASVPSATTTVKCPVINAAKPQAVPATGGL